MSQPSPEDGNDADSEESEIDERLDRILDFLATYLP